MSSNSTSYRICYNLSFSKEIGLLLPNAFVICTPITPVTYIHKAALPQVLEGYEIPYKDTSHKKLLEICQAMKPPVIIAKYQKKSKKVTLAQLLADKTIAPLIKNYVVRKMNAFFDIVVKERYTLTFEIDKKDPVERHMIAYAKTMVTPHLAFTKNTEDITYRMELAFGDQLKKPNAIKQIHILQDEPGIVLINNKLYQLEGINAKKITPFLNKEAVIIPKKNTRIYFEKFIAQIIKKVPVSTEGFKIHEQKTINRYTIELVYDLFQNKRILIINFQYENIVFKSSDQRTVASEILFENDLIAILQTKRDFPKENEITEALIQLGLEENDGTFCVKNTSTENEDPYNLVNWLSENKAVLTEKGFDVISPEIDQKEINLFAPNVQLKASKSNDWFDIHGTITVGDNEFQFSSLITALKTNNRLYELADGTYFIIPIEWYKTYDPMVTFGNLVKHKLQLPKSNFSLLDDLPIEINTKNEKKKAIAYQPTDRLKARLRPYQKAGVEWLLRLNEQKLGACLADDMGLGKTLQTIALLVQIHLELEETTEPEKINLDLFISDLETRVPLKTIIVLPASLIFNWHMELVRFAPHFSIGNYTGKDRKKIVPYLGQYDIVLTTYHTAMRDIEVLKKTNFNYFIADESQQLKNKDSKIFKALSEINTQHRISLSGTPIENSLTDLWSQMQFLNPKILGNYTFFKKHFQVPIEKEKDAAKITTLKKLIDPFILRRTKEEVAKELPELNEQIVYTEMLPEQKKCYDEEKSSARNQLIGVITKGSRHKLKVINTLLKLRQLANHPKLSYPETSINSGKFKDVIHHLETLLKSNKKILIFSSFVKHLEIYTTWAEQEGISFALLTGKTKVADRAQAVTNFQNDPTLKLFFISIKAGGTGLNLTKASYVVLLDPWWNPFVEAQAVARAHRIGQENPVFVSKFITKNSIEEKIVQLQNRKKEIAKDIVDVDLIPELESEELEALLA